MYQEQGLSLIEYHVTGTGNHLLPLIYLNAQRNTMILNRYHLMLSLNLVYAKSMPIFLILLR
jgi:hypothetical protein